APFTSISDSIQIPTRPLAQGLEYRESPEAVSTDLRIEIPCQFNPRPFKVDVLDGQDAKGAEGLQLEWSVHFVSSRLTYRFWKENSCPLQKTDSVRLPHLSLTFLLTPTFPRSPGELFFSGQC